MDKLAPLGRVQEYLRVAQTLLPLLPPQEQVYFLAHPVRFFSKHFVFRGLTPEKLSRLQQDGFYEPQYGYFGKAVYFTNNPFVAFGFTEQNASIIALASVKKLKMADENVGVLKVGSEAYKAYVQKQLDALDEDIDRLRVFSIDSEVDLGVAPNPDYPWVRNIELRKDQPVDVTDYLLIHRDNAVDVQPFSSSTRSEVRPK